jgi:hypothetical protein
MTEREFLGDDGERAPRRQVAAMRDSIDASRFSGSA